VENTLSKQTQLLFSHLQSYHLSPVVAVTEAVHICCRCTRFFVIYTKRQHGAKHTTTQLCNLTAKKGSTADEIAVHGGVILNPAH
jgi:hypothetical protein